MPSNTQVLTFEDFVKFPKFLFKLVGWVPQEINPKRWQKAFFLFMNCNMMFSLMILGMNILTKLRDPSKFLEITSTTACMGFLILCLVKAYGVAFRFRDEFLEILDQLDDFIPKNSKVQKEQKIPEKLRDLKKVMVTFFVIYAGSVALFNLMPFFIILYGKLVQGIDYDLQLPFKAWYPFDNSHPLTFTFCYIFQLWASFTSMFLVVGTDLLFCVCITVLCIRFEKLKEEVEGIVFYRDVKKCVETHLKLINISEKLDSIFSASILFNIIAASFIICFTGFQATAGVPSDIINFCTSLVVSLIQSFIICFYAERLRESSESIAEGVYSGSWYENSIKMQKCLHIIMLRAQSPQYVTAFKFTNVCRNTFTNILNASWSYYSLLKAKA